MAKTKVEVIQTVTYTPDHLDFQIEQLEKSIQTLQEESIPVEKQFNDASEGVRKAQEELEFAKDVFDEAAQKRDQIICEIDKRKQWLEALVITRGANAEKVNVHIARPTSHNEDKGKDKTPGSRLNWIHPAKVILEREKRLISAEELFQMVISENEGHLNKYIKGKNSTKTKVMENWISTAQKSRKRTHGTPVLGVYRDFLGLFYWFRKDGRPLPQFTKDVVFKGDRPLEEKVGARVVEQQPELAATA